ncbi:MAG TPA: hypothetical protein VGR43_00225 [Dehalococcoidia bacterium]|nr:hypothetical protein [Dehalococcoidia bacterium]
MAKADDLDALIAKYGSGRPSGTPCSVFTSGKRELIEGLHARGVQWQRISEILKAEYNLDITGTTLSRHGRHTCKCPQ